MTALLAWGEATLLATAMLMLLVLVLRVPVRRLFGPQCAYLLWLLPALRMVLPPLPFQAYAPPRPMDTVREVYRFAAEHPEVLSYVPCFCGCERGGHRGNDDCFVKTRNAQGDVTEWEPHGLDCAVCIDVANEAMQMHRSGASLTSIRAAIEKKWTRPGAGHTPTPMPHTDH